MNGVVQVPNKLSWDIPFAPECVVRVAGELAKSREGFCVTDEFQHTD